MSELRNLSLEAAKLAERDLCEINPNFADEEFRRNLTPSEKAEVFNWLLLQAMQYEQLLIMQIVNKV